MKRTNKLLALFVVLSVVVSLVCLPIAAANATEVAQGKTQNIAVIFQDVAGVDGSISYSNPDMFASVNAVVSTNASGEATKDAFYLYSDEAESSRLSFVLTVKVSAKAKIGETCTITFLYDTYDENGKVIAENLTKTETIKVVEASSNIDYSKLNEQIAIADLLVEKDYTADSWEVLVKALEAAKNAKTSKNQSVVDGAADALEAARLALVKLDYSALVAALAEVDAFYGTDETTSLLKQFVEAVMLGNKLLENGGSQVDIDATAAKILELLDALKEALNGVGETVIVEKEVPGETVTQIVTETVQVEVEVPVQNNLWLILFIITAILLVAAVAFLVVKYVQEKGTGKY